MKIYAISALMMILSGGLVQAQDGTGSSNDVVRSYEKIENGSLQKLALAQTCDGAELQESTQIADFILQTTRNLTEYEIKLPILINNAQYRNKVASTLVDRKCFSHAKEVYLSVIDRFTGNAFSSMRQRAQIGIDDMRSAQ